MPLYLQAGAPMHRVRSPVVASVAADAAVTFSGYIVTENAGLFTLDGTNIVCASAGTYMVVGRCLFTGTTGGVVRAYLRKGGVDHIQGNASNHSGLALRCAMAGVLVLEAGDVLTCVLQNRLAGGPITSCQAVLEFIRMS